METTWSISLLERNLPDNGVVTAHWRVTAVEGDFTASAYGTAGFTPDPTDPAFIPYENLTEAEVLGWCWGNGVDKAETEANLSAQIEADKNPTTANGVPWA